MRTADRQTQKAYLARGHVESASRSAESANVTVCLFEGPTRHSPSTGHVDAEARPATLNGQKRCQRRPVSLANLVSPRRVNLVEYQPREGLVRLRVQIRASQPLLMSSICQGHLRTPSKPTTLPSIVPADPVPHLQRRSPLNLRRPPTLPSQGDDPSPAAHPR